MGEQVMRSHVPRKRGHKHKGNPDSEARAPFTEEIRKDIKTMSGRAPAPLVPAYIYQNLPEKNRFDETDKDYIRRKLGMKIGKFAPSIERVSIRLEDINGPRGGVDQSCRIKVVISGLPSLVIEERSDSLNVAIDKALDGVEKVVKRRLQRRRRTKA